MFSLILIIFLFNLNLFTLQRQQQVTNKYVYVCGQYPNKYLSYAPCPEEGQKQQICSQSGWILMNIKCNQDSDCQISNQNVALNKCDRGECCAPPPSDSGGTKKGDDVPYIKWQMCENGGYFTGKKCKDTTECFSNRPNVQQICLHNECCTTGGIGGGNVNPVEDKCLRNGGHRLRDNIGGCTRHADCNILVGRIPELQQIGDNQQILCQQKSCCLMPRTLPIGFTDWAQACPQSGGSFIGLFCEMDHHDCQTTADRISRIPQRAICELRRYCCVPRGKNIDRQRRDNLGCNMGDFPTGSRCDPLRPRCFAGEYCGNQAICCLRSSYDRRRPPSPYSSDDYPDYSIGSQRAPAFCYNGQQSIVPCTNSDDCKRVTQACVNDLCCTRTGDEWKNACGGAMAVSSCSEDRSCLDRLVCTSSDYCCECLYGQAAGKCAHGCPPNYSCEFGGEYCCPKCPQGDRPYGSCFNGGCATGYICSDGNICCKRN